MTFSDMDGVRHLAIGMSHLNAIRSGHGVSGAPPEYCFVSLSGRYAATSPDVVDGHVSGVEPSNIQTIFLALLGNSHTNFALAEREPPIWTTTAAGIKVPADRKNRKRFRRAGIKSHLERPLARLSTDFALYRAAYPHAAIFAIGTPPPVGDANHILKYPSAFADRMHRGVAPVSLRTAIYDIQIEITREAAAAHGVGYISPPPEAVTAENTLAERYWKPDPTHGNEDYGKLVFAQMQAAVARETA